MSLVQEKSPPAADPFAWDPDPVVVVSRRSRIFHFPAALLVAEPGDDLRKKWLAEDSLPRDRREVQVTLNLGVTFLGCRTSAWAYRKFDGQAPRNPPPDEQRVLLEPQGPQAREMIKGGAFLDRETGRRRPDLVRAAWTRVFDYLRADENPTSEFFRAPDGFDAPEVIVCRLSELLAQTTEAGRNAYSHALAGAARCKDLAHLGALHDFAFRERRAAAIVTACRARALAVPENRL